MSLSKKYNLKDRSPCLFKKYDEQNLPTHACSGTNQNYNKILERDWLSPARFEH